MIKFSATLPYQYDSPFSPFSAAAYPQGLLWLKACGFNAVEIGISDYLNVDVRQIRAGLDKLGLGCSTIATGQARKREGLSLIDDSAAIRQRTQQRLYEHIRAARVLNSQVTIGSLVGSGDDGSPRELQDRLAQSLQPVIAYAQQMQVQLIIESVNRYENTLLNSAASAVAFLDQIDNPSCVGILWDVFHANIEDRSFVETIDLLGPRLKHVHFADSNRYFPGYGHINFNQIYQKLKASEFQHYISLECLNLPSAQTVIDQAGWFIAALRAR